MLNLLNKLRKPEAYLKLERTHYGIKIFLPENVSENAVIRALMKIKADSYKLPENQGIAFDFAGRLCTRNLILHMLNSLIWEKGLKVIAWLSRNPDTVKLLNEAGLSTSEPAVNLQEKSEKAQESQAKNEHENESQKIKIPRIKIVYGSMRGGQKVETDGDVLLWGHLNPGAEIIAGGSN